VSSGFVHFYHADLVVCKYILLCSFKIFRCHSAYTVVLHSINVYVYVCNWYSLRALFHCIYLCKYNVQKMSFLAQLEKITSMNQYF